MAIDPLNESTWVPSRKIYHELMARKVGDILLVSCPYDAFIMEEEGRLSTRIINEYKGLNLSRPPRLTWASSASEAFDLLAKKKFDLILAMPGLDGMDVHTFGAKVKSQYLDLPFFMLLHNTCDIDNYICEHTSTAVDRTYIWGGDADLLLAIIKNFEDAMNVEADTQKANVRVIILVEDSPYHFSSFLPVLYKQIVLQTQSVIDDSINEDQRLLKMRGRPKVLVAHDYEGAMALYEKYKPYVLSVFSDMRYSKNGREDDSAGYKFLKKIKKQLPDLPVLALSTEEHNREKVKDIPAVFINKTSNSLNEQIRSFFESYLGFGAFVFRMSDGEEIVRVNDLRGMERLLDDIPNESIVYHAMNNDFSRWFMARSEIDFALKLKPYKISDFLDPQELRLFLIESLGSRRKGSKQGKIIDFDSQRFDSDTDFIKIGNGSLGGKARGLAFLASQIKRSNSLQDAFPQIDICIPQTVVISTQGFKVFVEENNLSSILEIDPPMEDDQICERFVQSQLPDWLVKNLEIYLKNVHYPIAVRSSSLFEDAHYQPFAGLYNTYMLSNRHPNFKHRLDQLITAIKMVYASTYFKAPRSYAKSTMHRTEDEQMAVVIQQLTGAEYNHYFYPAISGVAQSYNFYPISHLTAEDGISYISLGFGKIVMEGGQTLRFCPKYPGFLPQFSIVEDILKNSQKFFYALKLEELSEDGQTVAIESPDFSLEKLDLSDVLDHPVLSLVASTYNAQDNRIRDVFSAQGFPVLTFANILKYDAVPLAGLLEAVTKIGSKWMGSSVEVEFAVEPALDQNEKHRFFLLQIRPMGRYKQNMGVTITKEDMDRAFCYSSQSLGNGEYKDIYDVVYVDPETFDPNKTQQIVLQINKINATFNKMGRKYILIGPGRWGTSDRWLGIPVSWNDISNVGVMVETTIDSIKADPSQGSHFFQNITSLGICYITVSDKGEDFINYDFFRCRECENSTQYLRHIKFENPVKILVDGKTSQAVLMPYKQESLQETMDDIPVIDS